MQRTNRVYYGWWVTGVCFLCVGARRGSETAYAVLLVALVSEFGWERGVITGAFALSMVVAGVLSPLAGMLLDRFPPRLAIGLGSAALGLTAIALASIHGVWALYLVMVMLFAPALALLNLGSLSAYLSRWFVQRRAFALGLSQTGQGVGIFVLTPLVGWLMHSLGWRAGYLVFGLGLCILLLPIALLVPRTDPQALGQSPDGHNTPSTAPTSARRTDFASGTWTLAQARRTSVFWFLLLCFYFFPAANQLFFLHLVAHLTDIGFQSLQAASVLSVAGLCSIPGRLLFGVLTDRLGGLIATQISFVLSIVAVILILLPQATWLPHLYVFAVVFGLSLGSRGVALGAFTADTFPGPEFGTIYGWITSGQLIGGACGPWLGGLVFDTLGSYELVFYGCIGGFALSALLIACAAAGQAQLHRARTAPSCSAQPSMPARYGRRRTGLNPDTDT